MQKVTQYSTFFCSVQHMNVDLNVRAFSISWLSLYSKHSIMGRNYENRSENKFTCRMML